MAPHTSGVVAYLAGKLTGVPYICSAHMDRKMVEKIENSKYRGLGWLIDFLERKVYENSIIIPVISHHVKKYVLSIAPHVKDKVILHRNFVDTEIFRPKKKNKNNTFVFVGRLEKAKGVEYLVEAAKILSRQGYKFEIIICGDGSERKSLECLVKKEGLLGVVKFKGYVKHSKLPDYLNSSVAMIVPLLGGFTIIEGMSCGLPIIAADIEWSSEVIKNNINGFIVPPENPTALANAMKRLIKNKKLAKKMGQLNRKIVVQEFSKKTWVAREISFYKLMINHL
jgi:glycosyltransferase involved in cell wall biosynthesis